MMRSSKLRTKVALAGGAVALVGGGLFAAAGAANAATPVSTSHVLQVTDSGQATAGHSAPSSAPATIGLPEGGTGATGVPVLPGTPGSVAATSANAGSAGDSAPAQTTTGS